MLSTKGMWVPLPLYLVVRKTGSVCSKISVLLEQGLLEEIFFCVDIDINKPMDLDKFLCRSQKFISYDEKRMTFKVLEKYNLEKSKAPWDRKQRIPHEACDSPAKLEKHTLEHLAPQNPQCMRKHWLQGWWNSPFKSHQGKGCYWTTHSTQEAMEV